MFVVWTDTLARGGGGGGVGVNNMYTAVPYLKMIRAIRLICIHSNRNRKARQRSPPSFMHYSIVTTNAIK